MGEVEKLRALLAEARDGLFDPEVSHDVVRCNCWVCTLARRIDAALAEPVVDAVQAWKDSNGYSDLLESYSRAIDERNKARAEVAFLKNHYSPEAASSLRSEVGQTRALVALREHERDEARAEVERLSTWGPLKRLHTEMEAEVKAAYQRGAEAMREAILAAWTVKNSFNDIRTMSIPEDK